MGLLVLPWSWFKLATKQYGHMSSRDVPLKAHHCYKWINVISIRAYVKVYCTSIHLLGNGIRSSRCSSCYLAQRNILIMQFTKTRRSYSRIRKQIPLWRYIDCFSACTRYYASPNMDKAVMNRFLRIDKFNTGTIILRIIFYVTRNTDTLPLHSLQTVFLAPPSVRNHHFC